MDGGRNRDPCSGHPYFSFNDANPLGCAGCHDPHSDATPYQLRVVGKPVQVAFTSKDAGLSAA